MSEKIDGSRMVSNFFRVQWSSMLRYLVQIVYLCCRSGLGFASLGKKYVWGVVLHGLWLSTFFPKYPLGRSRDRGYPPTIPLAADYTIIRSVSKLSPISDSIFSSFVAINAVTPRNVVSHLFPVSGFAPSQTLTTITCNIMVRGPAGLFIALGS